jgi:hypothetical protein
MPYSIINMAMQHMSRAGSLMAPALALFANAGAAYVCTLSISFLSPQHLHCTMLFVKRPCVAAERNRVAHSASGPLGAELAVSHGNAVASRRNRPVAVGIYTRNGIGWKRQ